MSYDKAKKLFGESVAKAIRTKLPLALDNINEFKVFIEDLVPCKDDYETIILNCSKLIEDKFKALKGVNETINKPKVCPYELLKSVDYELTRVTTVEQFMSFKQDFREGEVLCSFNNPRQRLSDNHCFWIRRFNASDIKPLTKPSRQDEYGTSSMSVQINKSNGQISIKNRYNHTVDNCDCTHGNDLNNIVGGLTDAIYGLEGMPKKSKQSNNLPNNIVSDSKGKLFVYEREINAVYLSAHGYLKDGVIYAIDKSYQRMYDDYLIDAKAKTAISVVRGVPLLS